MKPERSEPAGPDRESRSESIDPSYCVAILRTFLFWARGDRKVGRAEMSAKSVAMGADDVEGSGLLSTDAAAERQGRRLLAEVQGVLETELHLTRRNVERIHSLVALSEAFGRGEEPSSETNLSGAVGLAFRRGLDDMVRSQLFDWAEFFSDDIDAMDAIWSQIETGNFGELKVVSLIREMSADILQALDQTIMSRVEYAQAS